MSKVRRRGDSSSPGRSPDKRKKPSVFSRLGTGGGARRYHDESEDDEDHSPARESQRKVVCRAWNDSGCCAYGQTCRFSHPARNANAQTPELTVTKTSPLKRQLQKKALDGSSSPSKLYENLVNKNLALAKKPGRGQSGQVRSQINRSGKSLNSDDDLTGKGVDDENEYDKDTERMLMRKRLELQRELYRLQQEGTTESPLDQGEEEEDDDDDDDDSSSSSSSSSSDSEEQIRGRQKKREDVRKQSPAKAGREQNTDFVPRAVLRKPGKAAPKKSGGKSKERYNKSDSEEDRSASRKKRGKSPDSPRSKKRKKMSPPSRDSKRARSPVKKQRRRSRSQSPDRKRRKQSHDSDDRDGRDVRDGRDTKRSRSPKTKRDRKNDRDYSPNGRKRSPKRKKNRKRDTESDDDKRRKKGGKRDSPKRKKSPASVISDRSDKRRFDRDDDNFDRTRNNSRDGRRPAKPRRESYSPERRDNNAAGNRRRNSPEPRSPPRKNSAGPSPNKRPPRRSSPPRDNSSMRKRSRSASVERRSESNRKSPNSRRTPSRKSPPRNVMDNRRTPPRDDRSRDESRDSRRSPPRDQYTNRSRDWEQHEVRTQEYRGRSPQRRSPPRDNNRRTPPRRNSPRDAGRRSPPPPRGRTPPRDDRRSPVRVRTPPRGRTPPRHSPPRDSAPRRSPVRGRSPPRRSPPRDDRNQSRDSNRRSPPRNRSPRDSTGRPRTPPPRRSPPRDSRERDARADSNRKSPPRTTRSSSRDRDRRSPRRRSPYRGNSPPPWSRLGPDGRLKEEYRNDDGGGGGRGGRGGRGRGRGGRDRGGDRRDIDPEEHQVFGHGRSRRRDDRSVSKEDEWKKRKDDEWLEEEWRKRKEEEEAARRREEELCIADIYLDLMEHEEKMEAQAAAAREERRREIEERKARQEERARRQAELEANSSHKRKRDRSPSGGSNRSVDRRNDVDEPSLLEDEAARRTEQYVEDVVNQRSRSPRGRPNKRSRRGDADVVGDQSDAESGSAGRRRSTSRSADRSRRSGSRSSLGSRRDEDGSNLVRDGKTVLKRLDDGTVVKASPRHRSSKSGDDYDPISDDELDELIGSGKGESEKDENEQIKTGLVNSLEIDWSSLMKPVTSPRSPSSASNNQIKRFSVINVLNKVGVSKKLAGDSVIARVAQITSEARNDSQENSPGNSDSDSASATTATAAAASVQNLVNGDSVVFKKPSSSRTSRSGVAGLNRRAMSARADLALRRQLCRLSVKGADSLVLYPATMDKELHQLSLKLLSHAKITPSSHCLMTSTTTAADRLTCDSSTRDKRENLTRSDPQCALTNAESRTEGELMCGEKSSELASTLTVVDKPLLVDIERAVETDLPELTRRDNDEVRDRVTTSDETSAAE